MTVNSATKVTNLNADYVDGLDSTALTRVHNIPFNLAAGADSAPITLPANRPVFLMGITLTVNLRGVGGFRNIARQGGTATSSSPHLSQSPSPIYGRRSTAADRTAVSATPSPKVKAMIAACKLGLPADEERRGRRQPKRSRRGGSGSCGNDPRNLPWPRSRHQSLSPDQSVSCGLRGCLAATA
jgi:hypothetical protein